MRVVDLEVRNLYAIALDLAHVISLDRTRFMVKTYNEVKLVPELQVSLYTSTGSALDRTLLTPLSPLQTEQAYIATNDF